GVDRSPPLNDWTCCGIDNSLDCGTNFDTCGTNFEEMARGRLAAVLYACATLGTAMVAPANAAHGSAGRCRVLPRVAIRCRGRPDDRCARARGDDGWVAADEPVLDADVASPRINQTITFTGLADDPDGDIATYAWDCPVRSTRR